MKNNVIFLNTFKNFQKNTSTMLSLELNESLMKINKKSSPIWLISFESIFAMRYIFCTIICEFNYKDFIPLSLSIIIFSSLS